MASEAADTSVVIPSVVDVVIVVLLVAEGSPGGATTLIGFRCTLAVQPLGCLCVATPIGRERTLDLALGGEGEGGALGLLQPSFEELVAHLTPAAAIVCAVVPDRSSAQGNARSGSARTQSGTTSNVANAAPARRVVVNLAHLLGCCRHDAQGEGGGNLLLLLLRDDRRRWCGDGDTFSLSRRKKQCVGEAAGRCACTGCMAGTSTPSSRGIAAELRLLLDAVVQRGRRLLLDATSDLDVAVG